MNRKLYLLAIALLFIPTLNTQAGFSRFVKIATSSAVYRLDNNTARYVFPDENTYKASFGNDFSSVETISPEEMASYPLKGLVLYNVGMLIKIQTDPVVYEVVDSAGQIKGLANEYTAAKRHGADWNKKIYDISPAFFSSYRVSGTIDESATIVKECDPVDTECFINAARTCSLASQTLVIPSVMISYGATASFFVDHEIRGEENGLCIYQTGPLRYGMAQYDEALLQEAGLTSEEILEIKNSTDRGIELTNNIFDKKTECQLSADALVEYLLSGEATTVDSSVDVEKYGENFFATYCSSI